MGPYGAPPNLRDVFMWFETMNLTLSYFVLVFIISFFYPLFVSVFGEEQLLSCTEGSIVCPYSFSAITLALFILWLLVFIANLVVIHGSDWLYRLWVGRSHGSP